MNTTHSINLRTGAPRPASSVDGSILANLPAYRDYELKAMISPLRAGEVRPGGEVTEDERIAIIGELAKRHAADAALLEELFKDATPAERAAYGRD